MILWTRIMQFWQPRPIVFDTKLKTFFYQCLEKNPTQTFIRKFLQWTRRIQFSQLSQTSFDKSQIFFAWCMKVFEKESVSKVSSVETVLMNMWIEVLTKPAEIFFSQSVKFFFQRLFFFFQIFLLAHSIQYW